MVLESSASLKGDVHPASQTGSAPVDWADEHLLKPVCNDVLKPVANSLLIQPYDAVANVVNFVPGLFDKQLLPKIKPFQLEEAKFLSGGWWAQNISGGLATAAVFAGVGKLTGKLTGVGLAKFGVEGTSLGTMMASRQASQIIGGALYEGVRDTNQGESHLGNMIGGAVAFGVFEGGNSFAATGFGKYAARAATGGMGMTLGRITADSVTQKQLPTWQRLSAERDELTKTAVTGAAMNLLLPTLQRFGAPPESASREAGTGRVAYRPPTAKGFDLGTRTAFTDLRLKIDEQPVRSGPASNHATATEIPASLSDAHVEKVPMIFGAEPEEPGKIYDSREQYEYETMMVGSAKMKVMSVLAHPGTEVAMPLDSSVPISLPEAVEALHNVPDMKLVQRLTLLDQIHSEQEWLRRIQDNPNLTINAEAIEPGEIRVYKPGLDNLNENVVHEWNHLLRGQVPKAAAAFDKVGDLEPVQTNVNVPFPQLENDEIWSYLGEHLASMPSQPTDAVMTAMANPIRSTVWAKSVGERMANLSEGERTPSYESHQSLQRFISDQVKPQALASLHAASETGSDTARQARAKAILNFLNTQ